MIKKNEGFTCENCGNLVPPAGKGKCRNHCNKCLYSKHVDIEPGDRRHHCRGLMEPEKLEKRKDVWYILHRCYKCGVKRWNKILEDDTIDSQKSVISYK